MPRILSQLPNDDDSFLIVRTYNDTPWLGVLIFDAFVGARKNKRNTYNEWEYDKYALLYTWDLYYGIDGRTYRPSTSRAFINIKPVVREIFAADFKDRVVHHLVFNMTADWWQRHFIYDSYACQKGKGTLFGILRLYKAMAKASSNFKKEVWIYQFDLQGYFMSLPRKKIYEQAVWGLGRQFPPGSFEYNLCRYLWKVIIFDNPTEWVRYKGSRDDWKLLPRSKSLFHAKEGCGIVIGNLTSQLLSNIYMDIFDRFVKFELGHKYYGRYVDDFWIIGEKDKLKEDAKRIKGFLDSIGLKLHPKKMKLQRIERGAAFLGAVVYPHRIVPGKRIKALIYRSAVALARDDKGAWETLQSALGASMHFKSARVWRRAFKKTGLDGQGLN